MTRKKPESPRPVKEFIPPRKSRQVSSNIPPVPKCDVDKLLMLEAARPARSLTGTPTKSPLPPIRTPPAAEPPGYTETVSQEESQSQTEMVDEQRQGDPFFMTQVCVLCE